MISTQEQDMPRAQAQGDKGLGYSCAFRTGASLKFTLLNRQGRVWTLVAGGGASVVARRALRRRVIQSCSLVGCLDPLFRRRCTRTPSVSTAMRRSWQTTANTPATPLRSLSTSCWAAVAKHPAERAALYGLPRYAKVILGVMTSSPEPHGMLGTHRLPSFPSRVSLFPHRCESQENPADRGRSCKFY